MFPSALRWRSVLLFAMVFYEIVDRGGRGVHVCLIHYNTSTTHSHNAQPGHTNTTHNRKHSYKDTFTNTQPQRHIHSTQPQHTTTAHNHKHITTNTNTKPLAHAFTNMSDNMASRVLVLVYYLPDRMSQYMSEENVSVVRPVRLFFLCLCRDRHLTCGTPLSCKNVSHI